MDIQQLTGLQESCKRRLENALLEFVKENGTDCGEYEINEFGLDEGREGEGNITKVWNFFDNDGCYYIHTQINKEFDIQDIRNKHQGDDSWETDDDSWETDDAIDEEIYNFFDYSAFQCLYIVVDDDGNERLKYYSFSNGGCSFDDDQAEPDHDYVSKLSLVDLCFLIEAIRQNPGQPN